MKLSFPSCLLAAFVLVTNLHAAGLSNKHPNIIFILSDDQGYGDVSAHGNPILQTPNMDRLHNEGVHFTDFHVSPTCAPTRSALLTGRHEFKNGITHTILERERLALNAITLPQILKTVGYTSGIFGKWHLGDEDEYQPEKRGFDEVFIHGAGGIGQHFPGSCGDAPGNMYSSPLIKHNGKFEKTEGYCTDVFFSQATKWIESVKGKAPFYVHLATNVAHAPLQVRDEDLARYKDKTSDLNAAKFFGMLANLDDNIGKLLAKLTEWGIEKDTLIVFMNDNGGTAGCKIFNDGMRGTKGTPFLGGTRALSFWRWTGSIQPAAVDKLAAHIDFLPTLAEIAGAKLDAKTTEQVEGRSLVPLLENPNAPWAERTLFTHVGRWNKDTSPETGKYVNCSIRTPQYHLVSVSKQNKPEWMLFDVQKDHEEATDIAAANPNIVSNLQGAYESWWTSVVPMMVNENAPLAAENPFWTLYRKQFGSLPPEAEAAEKKNTQKGDH
ncbi:MAG: arylsulfatase [Verrucomicrobiota bacterium]